MLNVLSMVPVRACLFDMDGLLIDTEDIYTLCHNRVLASYGAGPMPWAIKSQLQGRPAAEAIPYMLTKLARADIPVIEYTTRLAAQQLREFPNARPLPGVEELLTHLSTSGSASLPVALATSSSEAHFRLKTAHLAHIFDHFPAPLRILGDDKRIPANCGKPAPDIYIIALAALNKSLPENQPPILPEECLVFEDGIPGVVAALRAGMRVIWVPHPDLAKEYKGHEDAVLTGCIAGLVDDNVHGSDNACGNKVVDRLAEQLSSLVDFPFERYNFQPQIPVPQLSPNTN
ncbi:HAD superfamily hydrolase [Blumeria hordei DH14]|uniref:HAD superfamily hydrolase n=1 Tax=Blumeria graminis f. sp. hordei (strain DH14) TaxID=546991 RepID=N1JEJ3_BLUG1|nr:HAD superfamily hydrolase [Blumeria hordei DH14]